MSFSYTDEKVEYTVGVTRVNPGFDDVPLPEYASAHAAGMRLLAHAVKHLGKRFADYLVVDGKFATAPFLHLAETNGLYVVARLKKNLPEFLKAVA